MSGIRWDSRGDEEARMTSAPARAAEDHDTEIGPAAIVASGLTKFYGKTPGIVDLDLEVRVGEVFGFLGPNGAGKTTTIRTLLDLLHPTSGTATVLGLDSHRDSVEVKRRSGYVPGDLAMYDSMTARQMLTYFGRLRGVDVTVGMTAYADRLNLDLDRKIGSYSSGNRQKVGVVQAFMHEPELLILDEPSLGLDPLMQQEFYRMIDEARAAGRTVFLSSHNLPEVERVADRVGIVRKSQLVALEAVDDLKAKARRRLDIHFARRVEPTEFSSLPGVEDAQPINEGHGVSITVAGSVDRVMKVAAGHEIVNIISHEGDLESAFLAYYEESPDAQ
jgi:ABC-2 type transport system ATP-binding protein